MCYLPFPVSNSYGNVNSVIVLLLFWFLFGLSALKLDFCNIVNNSLLGF